MYLVLAYKLFYAKLNIKFTVMKKLLLPFLLFFVGINCFAAYPLNPYASNLSISTLENGIFLYELNGVNYTPQNRNVYFQGINQGVGRLIIYRYRSTHYGQGQWLPVFNGDIQIPPSSNVFVKWDSWNGMMVSVASLYPNNPNYPNYPNNPNYPDYPNNPNYPNVVVGMNPPSFQGLILQIQSSSFDNNKVVLAKTAIRSNGISVSQLQQLLREFSFDSNRLDVAKYAYSFCADKNNYFMLSNSFDFESNARDLMKFIQ